MGHTTEEFADSLSKIQFHDNHSQIIDSKQSGRLLVKNLLIILSFRLFLSLRVAKDLSLSNTKQIFIFSWSEPILDSDFYL